MYTLHNTLHTRDTFVEIPATHCNTLPHTATHCNTLHCNTLQHTATDGKHTAQHFTYPRYICCDSCNMLPHTATHCNTLQHTATPYHTLQHTATHCNTLQHTATEGEHTTQHFAYPRYVFCDSCVDVLSPRYAAQRPAKDCWWLRSRNPKPIWNRN